MATKLPVNAAALALAACVAITTSPPSPRRASSQIPSGMNLVRGFTAPATWPATARMASSSSMAASTAS